MQGTETVLSVIRDHPETITGEPVAGKSSTAGSGRGRRKRTRIAGTSPAAYFTLWEPEGETPSGRPTARPRVTPGLW
jgi:cell division protein FtsI/penicillin-binding protein 2